jgi:hypothetical protein
VVGNAPTRRRAAAVAPFVRKQARLCQLRPRDHGRFASGAAAPRIGASRWLRPGAAASNLAADCCVDDAPPRLAAGARSRRARLSKRLARRWRCSRRSGSAVDLASASSTSTRGPPRRCSRRPGLARSLVVVHSSSGIPVAPRLRNAGRATLDCASRSGRGHCDVRTSRGAAARSEAAELRLRGELPLRLTAQYVPWCRDAWVPP